MGRVRLLLGGGKTREDDAPKGGETNAADSTDSDKEEKLALLTNNCTVLLYHISTSCCDYHDQLRPWCTGAYSTVDGDTFSSFCVPWEDLDCSLFLDLFQLLQTIVVLRQDGQNVGCGLLQPARQCRQHESLLAVIVHQYFVHT